jgi:metal-responsive CopG/Arc/MetJ family transcriptional regulator
MAIITVRIDDELKKRMEKEGHINWSEVIRRAIISRIEEEELWSSLDRRKLIKAASLNEAMRRRISGWDSVAEIRRWRELAGRGS